MKTNFIKRLGAFLCCISTLSFSGQTLSNIEPITEAGVYSAPKWSPDGKQLLCTNHQSNALYVVDVLTKSVALIKKEEGIGYNAKWSSDGKSIFFNQKQHTYADGIVKKISIANRSEQVAPKHIIGYQKATNPITKSNQEVIIYINLETLKLEARYGLEGNPWIITKEEGQYYHPILSPDGDKVVVHEGADMYIYDVQVKTDRQELGRGLASGWLADGSGILTFEDHSSDGHDVTESELFVITAKSHKKTQLTHTINHIEMWATASPDGKKIAFSDEKTGQIFVANLNLNP